MSAERHSIYKTESVSVLILFPALCVIVCLVFTFISIYISYAFCSVCFVFSFVTCFIFMAVTPASI